jgi:hypothetical protein
MSDWLSHWQCTNSQWWYLWLVIGRSYSTITQFVVCLLICFSLYIEYNTLVDSIQMARVAFQDARREGRRPIRWEYPPELMSFPSFLKWLHQYIRDLKTAQFPIPEDIVRLSSPLLKVVVSYWKMWAYGAMY